MFARATDASKVALVYLVRQLARWDFELIDCQVHTNHLASLGATAMSRRAFTDQLAQYCTASSHSGAWLLAPDLAAE
jgi:leucyl/phenylalanyl-tRNA--protein transferase